MPKRLGPDARDEALTTLIGWKRVEGREAFAKRFAGFEEKYKAALALSREINAKVSRAQIREQLKTLPG